MWRLCLLLLALSPLASAADHSRVNVDSARTSIYIGRVTLETTPLVRQGDRYVGQYKAKVFPYFFYNEQGTFTIDCDAEQLRAMDRGERVPFTGSGVSTDGENRHVEGYVQASQAGSPEGKIKVKIFVSKKIDLIFNTTYRFP